MVLKAKQPAIEKERDAFPIRPWISPMHDDIVAAARSGARLDAAQAAALADCDDLVLLTSAAAVLRDQGFGQLVTYSRKVFIPLTHLCRDVCHYCTFAQAPRNLTQAFMTVEQVLSLIHI